MAIEQQPRTLGPSSSVFMILSAADSPQRRCFCIDVTCDNLLDTVKQTVEDETLVVIKRRDADLSAKLREAAAEEQPLAAKAARLDGKHISHAVGCNAVSL